MVQNELLVGANDSKVDGMEIVCKECVLSLCELRTKNMVRWAGWMVAWVILESYTKIQRQR